jgi:hypothetical protein
VKAARPTRDYDARWQDDRPVTTEMFVERYTSRKKNRSGRTERRPSGGSRQKDFMKRNDLMLIAGVAPARGFAVLAHHSFLAKMNFSNKAETRRVTSLCGAIRIRS